MRPERTGSSAGGLRCLAPRAALLQVVQLYIDLPPFEAPAAHFRRGRFLRRHPHAARLPSGDVTTAPRRSPLPCPRNRCFRTCRVVRIKLGSPYSFAPHLVCLVSAGANPCSWSRRWALHSSRVAVRSGSSMDRTAPAVWMDVTAVFQVNPALLCSVAPLQSKPGCNGGPEWFVMVDIDGLHNQWRLVRRRTVWRPPPRRDRLPPLCAAVPKF